MKKLNRLIIPVICTGLVLLAFKFVFFLGYVPSESMEPTLKKDSFILGVRVFYKLKTGDMVIFVHDGKTLVKRIAAAEGGRTEHNGALLTVPQGMYYMLGDNAANSFDSRFWEYPFVPREDIKAKVILPRG